MDTGDTCEYLSVQWQRSGLTRKVFFWSEILLLAGAVGFSGALLVVDHSAVQLRRTILKQYEGSSQFRCVRRDDPAYPIANHAADVSWFRKMLGDEAVTLILLPPQAVEEGALARVRAAFPEARVERFPLR